MGSLIREWVGLQQFPAATQAKLIELLGKLKQENVNALTILVLGKGGMGKSSTVNSLIGEQAVRVSSFQAEGMRPVMVTRSRAGFTINIIDTPGLVEGGYVNYQGLELIKGTIDVMLFVDRLDAYRVDELDKQVIRAITQSFGKEIWCRSLLVLTHAQLCPPDELNYDVFSSKRAQALRKTIHMGARIRKRESVDSFVPVILVENSGRCNKNESDEKVLPNGETWVPNLVKGIVDVATSRRKAVVVDKKLIDGSNADDKGKMLIPLIIGIQYIVVKLIQRGIRNDIAKSGRSL